MEYLLREDAPFGEELWEKIDEVVIRKAKEQLIGRKFIPIYGPLGPGVQNINIDLINANKDATISSNGEEEIELVAVKTGNMLKYLWYSRIFSYHGET